MYIVQKRESPQASWKTCSHNGHKCKYDMLPHAWAALRSQKNSEDTARHPLREFRILDGATNSVVE